MTGIRRTLRHARALVPGIPSRGLWLGSLVGLLCLASPILAAGQETSSAPARERIAEAGLDEWSPTAAEPGALEEVLAATEVEAAPETISWGHYGLDLGNTLMRSLTSFLDRSIHFGGLPSFDFRLMAKIFLVLIGLLLAIWLGAYLYRRVSRPKAAPGNAPPSISPTEAAAARGGGSWRRELDRLLAAGDLTPEALATALEALWWWLARSLAGERADASWTSGDLLRHTGRRELRSHLAALDALRYDTEDSLGADRGPDLRELVRRFDQALSPQLSEAPP